MKVAKIVAALVLAATAGIASAQGYTEFQYYNEENRNTHADNMKLGVVVGTKTADKWDYSLKFETSQAELGNGSIGQSVEGRVKKSFDAGFLGLKPYVGVRLGEKISSSQNFSYYAVDVGTKFPIIGDLSGDVGYRYRNSFNTTDYDFQSNRYHVAVAYALTKNDSIAVRYSQAYGASAEEKNSWRLAYSHSF